MLKDLFQNKHICVVGIHSILGKLFIRQLVSNLTTNLVVYAIELPSDVVRRQKYFKQSYFSNTQRQFLQTKVTFVPVSEASQKIQNIDVLFDFFIPIDFSQFEKAMDYHISKTRAITQELAKIKGQIKKCVMISSIYCQNPGFVGEAQKSEEHFLDLAKDFTKNQFQDFLKDNFSNARQCWQWSIKSIEREYKKISNSLQIVRVPSLGPTLNNYQGYSDKFNYFTYFVYMMGTGFFQSINGRAKNIIDVIPADYMINYMIVIACKESQGQKYRVHNLSSSSRNPIQFELISQYFKQAWEQYQNKSVKLKINDKKWQRNVQEIRRKLPLQIKSRLAQIFDLKQWRIQAQKQNLTEQKKQALASKYQYFLQNQWICESNYSIDFFNQLQEKDRQLFNFNVNSINWKAYAKLCCYSIKKYLLNQHVEEFKPLSLDLLTLQSSNSYFSDIIWALTEGKVVKSTNPPQIKNFILSTKSVKQAIKVLVQQRMLKLQNEPIAYQKAEEQLYKVADQMCQQMFSQYNMKSIRLFAWFLHKVFKTIYERVVIDKQAMMKLRNHNQKEHGPLIIIPTHRSYVDFLIMGYVFFGYGIKLAHIAAAQDFLNMAIVHILLRKSGAFFIKRNQLKNKILYKAIMEQYISKILKDQHYLEFFIEGTRCRVGKMLPPKFGILSIVCKNVLEGKIPDAQILPITVNYQKVLQGQSFTYQMMGESKVKQSLSRLIKAADTLKQNYGRIYIDLCEPISIKQYFQYSNKPYAQTLSNLGHQIVYRLSDNLVITSPAILATVVLMYRKGISDDNLAEKVLWLCKQISSRGIKIARSQSDSSISITTTLSLLSDIITKSKKNMFQVQVSLQQDSFIKLFTMTYYRNTLTHIFFEQAIVMVALVSFGHQNIITKSITFQQLYQQTKFLYNLLKKQYVLRHDLSEKGRFNQIVELLIRKQVLRKQQNFVLIGKQGQSNGNYFSFYGSLIWPIVQSYWITCLYLFKLSKNKAPIPMEKFLTEIQWFAQSLITQRIISHHEAISSDTIKNAVAIFTSLKLIKTTYQDYNGANVSSVVLNVDDKALKKFQQKIQVFLKKSYAKSVKGILQSGQGSVNLDFPFLSKL